MSISRKTWWCCAAGAVLLLIAVVWFIGNETSDKNAADPAKIEIISGADQCELPNTVYPEKLSVRIADAAGEPLCGVEVSAAAVDGCGLKINPDTMLTDAGGMVRFEVASGAQIGDGYVNISVKNNPELKRKVRFVSGVQLLGSGQEGHAGAKLPDVVGVKLTDAKGNPRPGVTVHFNSRRKGAVPEKHEVVSGSDGVAATAVKLPGRTGINDVEVEIAGNSNAVSFRSIRARLLSFDSWTLTVNVLGGLALFMLGMKMMSDGLSSIAGEKMKGILRFCTNNRFMALTAGTVITAVIQSSSASTVMVIGFVNAGLMTLAQSVGVIFGANIGTTITAQIVAFNVGAVAMPAIILGLAMSFIRRSKVGEIGLTILGFGLLFFGMNLMGAELKSLAEFPTFREFFMRFDCRPVDGVMPVGNLLGALLIGLLATVVVQSSSATTGVVIVLGTGGLINLYTAVALILGANVGTTITAQLAAIPANRPARQAALAHTLFNVSGVVLLLISFWIPWGKSGVPIFFYFVNAITEGDAFAAVPENLPRHIANAHTAFNLLTALLLLPFTRHLAVLCEKLMPLRQNKVHFQYLEPHLLDSPALALRQTVIALTKMLKKSCRMIDVAVRGNFIVSKVDENKMGKFNNREEKVDRYQSDIVEYLAQIMRRKISPKQALTIPKLMHCANDAERIADRAANIITLTRRLEADELKLSRSAVDELEKLFETLSDQMTFAHNALESSDSQWMTKALAAESEISNMAIGYEREHIQRMKNERCTPKTGIIYVELLSELVAVSRHLSNIAERAVVS